MTNTIEAVAAKLRRAERDRVACLPVRSDLAEGDLDAAYAVQAVNVAHAKALGRRIVGRKIGLTARAVQRQLGVEQPDYGTLFADMAVSDGETIAPDRVMQPKLEAEVALVLERDLAVEQPTLSDLLGTIGYALPAIEVVGSRIANWDIRITDTIADNASSGAFVLGNTPRKLESLDLRLCGMAILNRGEPVSVGAGAACLGHPLNAAVWLARTMVRLGQPLRAGDIILTGALGPMVAVKPGEAYEAHISGLGAVRARFAEV
jgi:2-keto-4-pentenoate hydratase